MKCKKILTALLAAACTMSGCHGDLDIMQDNKLSASNMWIDESDAETATYGIYLYMRDALKSVHDIYLCWGEFRNGLWGAGTNKTLSGVDQTQVRTSTMSSSNAYADWSVMYKTVNQANLILKHVPEMGISESVRNFSLGNAYFSRAWCYFWIARIWGDAPLALTGYDLTEAERYVTDNSDKAVATPAAVQMLKADYALWMYRVAGGGSSYLTMAEEAIETLNLSASRLESDYAQVFSSANKLNKEVIFAVHQANGEAVNGPGYYLGWNSNYVEAAYQNNPVPITGGNQWWWYTDRYKALLTSVEGDTRTKLTYNRADYGTTIKSIEWTEKGVGQMISGARIFDSDFILYRYAEAFLMDAEIKYYRKDYGGAGRNHQARLRQRRPLHRSERGGRKTGHRRGESQRAGRRRAHVVDADPSGRGLGVQQGCRRQARKQRQHSPVAHHAGVHHQEFQAQTDGGLVLIHNPKNERQ